MFDKEALIERLMGDDELLQTVISEFLEDIPLQIETLKGYLASGDASGSERQLHTIKGAAANISAEALCKIASDLEKAGKSGDLNAVKSCLPKLEKEFERLKQAMEK